LIFHQVHRTVNCVVTAVLVLFSDELEEVELDILGGCCPWNGE